MGLLKHVFIFFRVQNLEKIVIFKPVLASHAKFEKKNVTFTQIVMFTQINFIKTPNTEI